ncbi:MAG: regulatory protein RecX [Methylococcaceae bacterium]
MRYLAQREHSRLELAIKVARKDFPEDLIDAVLDELSNQGLQSDLRYAEAYVRSRASKGYGCRRIIEELKQRGIERDALPDFSEYDWDHSIVNVYTKKYGNLLPRIPAERARRENFLRMRGFSSDEIRQLFRSMTQTDDHHD